VAAARLRAALDATVAALAEPNLDALLAAEAGLTDAFAELSYLRTLDDFRRRAVRDELLAAQSALLRARRLGGSLGDVVRISLQAHGQAAGYDPARAAATTLAGRGFETRA
jgi:hypothetical protein